VPLDPAARQLVDALSEVFPDVGGKVRDAAEARRILARAPLAPGNPRRVERVVDQSIPGPAGALEIPLRIYWPVADARGLPVIVFFHGGGWVLCNLDTHDPLCRVMTNEVGAIVVSVDYRLAPEHRFPAAAEDAYAATRWVAANARELGADPTRLAVAGDSAGGNLAAVVALMARDRGAPPLRFQLLVYPVIDHACDTASYRENAEGYFLTAAHMRWYWDQYLGDLDRSQPYASPLRAPSLAGLPPAHIVTAELDPLRDEAEAYAERLRAAGVPVTVRRASGMFHGFFGMAELLEGARQANDEAFRAVREALAGYR
jgi:acetyl esterase